MWSKVFALTFNRTRKGLRSIYLNQKAIWGQSTARRDVNTGGRSAYLQTCDNTSALQTLMF